MEIIWDRRKNYTNTKFIRGTQYFCKKTQNKFSPISKFFILPGPCRGSVTNRRNIICKNKKKKTFRLDSISTWSLLINLLCPWIKVLIRIKCYKKTYPKFWTVVQMVLHYQYSVMHYNKATALSLKPIQTKQFIYKSFEAKESNSQSIDNLWTENIPLNILSLCFLIFSSYYLLFRHEKYSPLGEVRLLMT